MKTLAYVLGILTGLAFSRIPHYLDQYADHSLPAPWEAPKLRRWHNGEPAPWLDDEPDEAGFEKVSGL